MSCFCHGLSRGPGIGASWAPHNRRDRRVMGSREILWDDQGQIRACATLRDLCFKWISESAASREARPAGQVRHQPACPVPLKILETPHNAVTSHRVEIKHAVDVRIFHAMQSFHVP